MSTRTGRCFTCKHCLACISVLSQLRELNGDRIAKVCSNNGGYKNVYTREYKKLL